MSAEILAALADLKAGQERIDDTLAAGSARRSVRGAVPAAPPAARRGESVMGSRGFQFGKAISALRNAIPQEEAKVELEFAQRFTKCMRDQGWKGERGDSLLLPFWPEAFPAEVLSDGMYMEMKCLLEAGVTGADPNEVMDAWRSGKSAVSPAMSWVDQSAGGSFVGPPQFGPPIELARNAETILQVATIVPLGPTGQITMPRLTQATQGGWLGENTAQAPVNPGTGSLNLRAKKAFAIVVVPGELQRYGAPAAEVLIRNDMFKTCSLVADAGFLTGSGSDKVPQGILTAAGMSGNPLGVSIVTPTNANTLSPQDVYKFPAAVEEANGEMNVWIMKPTLFWNLLETRATTQTGTSTWAQAGQFVFGQFRAMQDGQTKTLNGIRVITSRNVPANRGNGSQTALIGCQCDDFLVGMFGAIEMSATDQGWTLFSSDQIAIRAILSVDGGMRHPGWFGVADALNLTPGN